MQVIPIAHIFFFFFNSYFPDSQITPSEPTVWQLWTLSADYVNHVMEITDEIPQTKFHENKSTKNIFILLCWCNNLPWFLLSADHGIHPFSRQKANIVLFSCIYPKHWGTLIPYYTCPKILTRPFYYQCMCLKIARWMANSVDPFCSISSGSALFA